MTGARDACGRLSRLAANYSAYVRVLWLACPGRTLVCAVILVVSTLATVGAFPVVGELVTTATQRDSAAWYWFGAFVGLQVVAQVLGPIGTILQARAGRDQVARIVELIGETGMTPRDLTIIEGPLGARLRAVHQGVGNWELTYWIDWFWRLVSTRLRAVGSLAIVMTWNWWAGILAAAAVMLTSRAFELWAGMNRGPETRQSNYDRDLLIRGPAAKEIRLFGWAGWLQDLYVRAWSAAYNAQWANTSRTLLTVVLASVIALLASGGTLALLGSDAFRGVVTVATTITIVQAILGLQSFGGLGDAQIYTTKLAAQVGELCDLRSEFGLSRYLPEPSGAVTVGGGRAAALKFESVGFTYPSRQKPVLQRLDLSVPAGQRLAIVGLNGAGKTTLVKLLCGLYPVDSGTITIDGVPVTGPQAGRVAVIFQDFQRYPLSLRDNVAFGAPAMADNPLAPSALVDSLQRASGDRVLQRIADGYDGDPWNRVLSSEYTAGTELSGGQWQRVALARAFAAVAGGARVLVLDEPTAALDVRAEAELFEKFLAVTKDVTTILVSHRLASVRRADRIVVLDGDTGRLIEDGTHDQLLAAGRGYARLYRLQAKRLAAAGGEVSSGEYDDATEDQP